MTGKFLLPALAIALLGGCVTSGYQYRGGYGGDYYYGQPQVEYRDYGMPYGNYGYPGGWGASFGFGFGHGGGWPYGYYGGFYDPYPYDYPRHRVIVRPHPGGNGPPADRGGRERPPPWRDLGGTNRPGVTPPLQPQRPAIARPDFAPPRSQSPPPRRDDLPRGREP